MLFIKFIKRWLSRSGNSQRQIFKAFVLMILLNFVFGFAFYIAEKSAQPELTMLDSIWWAMVTMTTVGYGDFYPQTIIGRFVIAYAGFFIGIGLLGYLVGVIADAMIQRVSKKRKGLIKMNHENHVIICNCPSIEKVLRIVSELREESSHKNKAFVLITDSFEEMPEELVVEKIKFIKGNPTQEDVLIKANVMTASGVLVLAQNPTDPDSDMRTYATGSMLELIEKEKNKPIKVTLEVVSNNNIKLMRRAATDGLVSPDGIGDRLLAQEFLHPGIHDVFQQLLTNTEGSQFYCHTTCLDNVKIQQLQVAVIEHPTSLQIIGIIKNGVPVLNPPKSTIVSKGDILVLLAETSEDFAELENSILKDYLKN